MFRKIVVVAGVALSWGLAWGQAQVKDFDLAAQDAASGVAAFARQADVQLLVSEADARNRRTNEIHGKYSVAEALEKLLKGTGLAAEPTGTWTWTVVDESREGKVSHGSGERLRVGQADAVDQSDEGAGNKLEEIVVTAQKREERLQDVPISIGVVTAADIDRRGLVSSEDYLRGMPGVNQSANAFGQSIVIRGMETNLVAQNFYSGATVATYFGETPTTGSQGGANGTNIDLKVVDVERVEVLRGPQGTAFGSAALGGAVRTIPAAPKLDRFEGKVAGGYSATSGTGADNNNLQAVANIPLNDKIALRAVGYYYRDSGYYKNISASNAAFQAAAVVPYDAQAFATDANEMGATRSTGGRLAALFQANDDLKFTLSYLYQKDEIDGMAFGNTAVAPYLQVGMQIAPEHVRRGQKEGYFDSDIGIANAMMEYELGWGGLLATYSHIKSTNEWAQPLSAFGTFFGPTSYHSPGDHRGDTGEIRLVTHLQGAWNFIGGLYIEDLTDDSSWDAIWHGSPETNFWDPISANPDLGVQIQRRDLTQKAAFTEASWKFLPKFTLTGGARVYDYRSQERFFTDGSLVGNFGPESDSVNTSGTSFRSNLTYKPSDDALLYATWSQGFRLGRAQHSLPSSTCDRNGDGLVDGTNVSIASTRKVGSDSVDNYELGAKLTIARRLMIAGDVYRMDWTDLPVLVGLPGGADNGCFPNTYTSNVGAARSEGVEFQMNYAVTQALRIDLGGSWVRAELTKDAPNLGASKGARLAGSPDYNANLGLPYEFNFGGYKTSLRADSIYVGSFRNGIGDFTPASAGNYLKLDASLRLALRQLDVTLFGRNLTNVDKLSAGGGDPDNPFSGYYLRPRTIGVDLQYRF